jgi:alkylation response protein AidB-like acyl-CoA dehydrogenase
MDLELNSDQSLIAQSLERWATDHMEVPVSYGAATYLPGEELADELAEQGYLDIAREPDFGALGGVLLIEAVTHTPWAIEVGASGLIAPMLGLTDLPRPLAVLTAPETVARFLVPGGAALVEAGDSIRLLNIGNAVKPVTNLYPYPFGRYDGDVVAASRPLDVDPEAFRAWRRLALAAEALGTMDSAVKVTTEYVRTRVQFRRPIGSFQTVQHKLAECVSLVHGARLITLRAAQEGGIYIDHAVSFVHDAANRVALEATQFHGAIGQTLEYPLHHWVYRLRILQHELFGELNRIAVPSAMAV